MTPYVATSVRIEEIAALALEGVFTATPGLSKLFKTVGGDAEVKPVGPKLSVNATSQGEHPLTTGIHKLNFTVELDANPEDVTPQTIKDMWAAVVGVIYQSNLPDLLNDFPPFFCYGIIRKPQGQGVGGNSFHRSVQFTGFGIEIPPS